MASIKAKDRKLLKKLTLRKTLYQKEKVYYSQKIDHFFLQSAKKNDANLITEREPVNRLSSLTHPKVEPVSIAIDKGKRFLISLQEEEKYWNARLDSNVGLNGQYILLKYFLALETNHEKEQKIIHYIIKHQNEDGSWSIYYGGPGHLSYTITAYFALKLSGYSEDDPRMVKARQFILSQGGITQANVETRFWLALLDQYSWNGLPPIPVQIVLAPSNFYFSIYNISYWCRTSLVPMSVIYNKKLVIHPPKEAYIDELYVESVDIKNKVRFDGEASKLFSWENLLLQMSKGIKVLEKTPLDILDKIALKKAKDWIVHHQDDSGDWGGIYPAIQYSIMALKILGYSNDSPEITKGVEALDRFMIESDDDIMLSACTSPVWDTAWAILALTECRQPQNDFCLDKAYKWLYSNQILREGDWAIRNPDGLPGGWCFQFYNDFYPDTDDSAVVLMALIPSLTNDQNKEAFKIGVNWLLSMQNNDGGWGAFERNVDKEIMNYLPLNDIRNFLDQSSSDVTGRILELLGQLEFTLHDPVIKRAVNFIIKDQKDFGAWYGRWGVNYIYGTWSVLRGLRNINADMKFDYIQKAVVWLKSCQNNDGGWGESCRSYDNVDYAGIGKSTASQTAWALMALLCCDEETSEEVTKGIDYLINTQNAEGGWDEIEYTGTGFEGAFYLRYYYYPYYFPMLALGKYYKLIHKKIS